jgi:hypothetical protein
VDPLRHEKMLEEHTRQRAHLRSDITEAEKNTMSSVEVAASIGGFGDELMRDTDAEERELLLRSGLLDGSSLSDGESG